MKNTKDNKASGIPVPTIRRLPLYHSFLLTIKNKERKYISAPDIANELQIDPTQIIKDFSYLNVKGKTKVGYVTSVLIKILEEFLGYHISRKAFIVGIGNLGSALIKYHRFHNEGMEITAGFDINPEIINTKTNNLKLFHIDQFQEKINETPVDIGIIVVPADQAQKIADLMIKSGVKAIWNFSGTPLSAPDNIIIENTSIDSGLAMIKWKLHENKPLIYKNRML
ncbi:MAG: redox-sensing transcriptional repressor Rex [Bacteroidales bacterium]|nr:redox-sensing transcriptional repressor Rex [Bacteroidales bacterium]